MQFKGRRGLVALAAVAASVAVSGIGASGAQAAGVCTGHNIHGEGSSLQGTAQTIWTSGFNTNANGCNGARQPRVTYTPTSSGQCLTKWGADGVMAFDPTVQFCGTDDAPTTAQIANIRTAANGSGVLSIAVAQAAIAILVNPPANCTITNATPGQIEGAFRGTTTWTTLGASGSGCDTLVTRVARADSSGTTYQLKHYFTGVNTSPVHGAQSWRDLQSTPTTWPDSNTVDLSRTGCLMNLPCSGPGSGGGDEVKTVAITPNSIGYAALADARTVYANSTYTNSGFRWIAVRPAGTRAAAIDPSTNGFTETRSQSNCSSSSATGTYGTLPGSATVSWADVYMTNAGLGYPICTLTWDTALSNYAAEFGATGAATATSVRDYLHYITISAGGQNDALRTNNDYAPLPEDVRHAATTGVQEIG